MSIRKRVAAILAVLLGATTLSPCAIAQAFDATETRALNELIKNAVTSALDDPSVGDGNSHTHPPATVFRSEQAPGLSENQRIELARMVDEAIKRAVGGELSGATDVALAGIATTPEPAQSDGELSDPILDLTADALGRKKRVAAEQGLDVAGAEATLYTQDGHTNTALVLTDTGINSAETAPSTSNLQIVANGEGSRASLKFDLSGSAANSTGSAVYWARSLAFSAPLDKNDALGTTLIGLDGLTNNFEVAFNASRIRTESLGRPDDGKRSLLFDMPTACTSLGIAIDECNLSTLLRVAAARSSDPSKEIAEKAKTIAQRYSITGRAWLQGFRLKAGYDNFSFFDPDNLVKHSRNEIPWSTGVFVGVLSGASYYSAGLDYQRTYKAGTSGTACALPGPDDTAISCVSGALGAPSSKQKYLATLEGRWLFGSRAVGVKVVHDFNNDNWGVDIPLYLFPNDKGMFSGGLRFGWTDTDQFSAGVFVGVPFKLLD